MIQFVTPSPAYVGPGAGFAASVSLLTAFIVILSAVLAPFLWPALSLLRLWRRRKLRFRHGWRRVVVLGLDGLDEKVLREMIEAGKLPHFAALAREGHFSPLQTVAPAITPAAWSSFLTGADPSYHGIFDFVTRDPQTYLPKLSSAEVREPARRLRLFRWSIPLGRTRVRGLRKGTPFWHLLARYGVETTVLRVPITFPPEPFAGSLLSGMCVPDLLGTQGVYTLAGTGQPPANRRDGRFVPIRFRGHKAVIRLEGPADPLRPDGAALAATLRLRRDLGRNRLVLQTGGEKVVLRPGQSSSWLSIRFDAGPVSITGLARVHLVSLEPEFLLYISPVNIHPERPALAISHPRWFSSYLAKLDAPYGTLGLLEDTTAFEEGALPAQGFLEQVDACLEERKKMFFRVLERLRSDVTICVFDTPDRVGHMFWREYRQTRSAKGGADGPPDPVQRMMRQMDDLLGQTRQRLPPDTLLLVLSDHGMTDFRRTVNLNAWLRHNGYLHLREDAALGTDWLQGVDWSRTRAYALGLTGLFINLKGRESKGIVEPGKEAARLIAEIKEGLETLCDPQRLVDGRPARPIRRAIVTADHYAGPCRLDGPDLIIGYATGYRCSWECARGQVADQIFADNTRQWSGDHCVDPDLVPGVLLSNAKLPDHAASILDLAPTILDVFGIPTPRMWRTSRFPTPSADLNARRYGLTGANADRHSVQ